MGMEVLRCKSPAMLHKELEMFFIAYNLIRCLIVEAGAINDVALERMSFKGTVDSMRQFSLAIAGGPRSPPAHDRFHPSALGLPFRAGPQDQRSLGSGLGDRPAH